MKRLFFATLCVLLLSSCAASYSSMKNVVHRIYSSQMYKDSHYARYKRFAMNIKCEYCPYCGAYVRHNSKYCFSIEFGTIKLRNTEYDYIELYEYDPSRSEDWLLVKKMSRNGPFEDILAYKNGQPMILSFVKIYPDDIYMNIYTATYQDGKWRKERLLTNYVF